jgi:hypothetical protein
MTIQDNSVFSFLVKVGHVSANPVTITISADQSDLKKLAAQWGVPEVRAFDAEIVIGRWKRDGVRLKGNVTATIVQDCVVTLDPVSSASMRIWRRFSCPRIPAWPAGSRMAMAKCSSIPKAPTCPTPFSGDSIDVGAVAAEFAALGDRPVSA